MNSYKKNRGMTLIETVLVVGLISLFLLGVYVIFNKVSAASAASDEAREINGILAATRSLIGGTNYVASIDAKLLADARIIDQSRVSGTRYTSGTGQTVSFDPVFNTGVSHIKVTYHDTSMNYCAKLSAAFTKDVDLMTINGTVVQNTMPTATRMEYRVDTAAAACASGGDFVDMSFNFRR